jgi:hypothetical protein
MFYFFESRFGSKLIMNSHEFNCSTQFLITINSALFKLFCSEEFKKVKIKINELMNQTARKQISNLILQLRSTVRNF